MHYQAFFDESGSHRQSPVFLIGGLISTVELWDAFTKDWNRTLGFRRGVEYFRMNEAYRGKGQFAKEKGGGLMRGRFKLHELMQGLAMHVNIRVSIYLERADFDTVFAIEIADRHPLLSNPYCICFTELLRAIIQVRYDQNLTGKFEFIFDDNAEIASRSLVYWRHCAASLPDHLQPYAGDLPVFGDDKECAPLQAADVYAWYHRRLLLDDIEPSPFFSVPPLKVFGNMAFIDAQIDVERMTVLRERILSFDADAAN